MLAGDLALIGGDLPLPAGKLSDRRHRGLAIDGRAAVPRAPRQSLGQVCRLDIAVRRMLDRADDAVDLAQRPDRLDLFGREEVDVYADRPRHTGIIPVLVHPVLGPGEAYIAHITEADVQFRLRLEGRIEAHGILVQLPDRIAEVEQRQETRRVPGRAGGQLLALQEHAVGEAELGQVIEGRHPHHAPADDDCARVCFHDEVPGATITVLMRTAFDLRCEGATSERMIPPQRRYRTDLTSPSRH